MMMNNGTGAIRNVIMHGTAGLRLRRTPQAQDSAGSGCGPRLRKGTTRLVSAQLSCFCSGNARTKTQGRFFIARAARTAGKEQSSFSISVFALHYPPAETRTIVSAQRTYLTFFHRLFKTPLPLANLKDGGPLHSCRCSAQ